MSTMPPADDCTHVWRYVRDWIGDPDVINGTQQCDFLRCELCDEEVSATSRAGAKACQQYNREMADSRREMME